MKLHDVEDKELDAWLVKENDPETRIEFGDAIQLEEGDAVSLKIAAKEAANDVIVHGFEPGRVEMEPEGDNSELVGVEIYHDRQDAKIEEDEKKHPMEEFCKFAAWHRFKR